MDNLYYIEKIILNNEKILFVKPKSISFEMIYRSAMGVYWDLNMKSLYCKFYASNNTNVLECFNLIKKAIYNEYGVTLLLNSDTIFENINESLFKSV